MQIQKGRMMLTNLALIFVLAFILLPMGFQIAPASAQRAIEGKTEIVIGGFSQLTGPVAHAGIPMKESVTLAVEEWNKAGGILGLPVKLVWYDDRADPSEAVSAVTKLIELDKVVAIIGGWMSDCTLAASEVYEKAKVPCFTVSLVDKIFQRGFKYVFLNSTPFFASHANISDWMIPNTKVRRLGLVVDDSAAGRGIQAAMVAGWVEAHKKEGAELIDTAFVPVGTTDFYPVITRLLAKKPDGVMGAQVGTGSGLFVRQLREQDPKIPNFGTILFSNDAIIDIAGNAADGTVFYTFAEADDPRTPMAKHLVEAYKVRWNKRPSMESFKSYESAQILKHAIETAKSLNSIKIRDAIAATKGFEGVGQKTTFMENGVSTKKGFMAKVVAKKRVILADIGYVK